MTKQSEGLTPRERRILEAFLARPGEVHTTEDAARAIWGDGPRPKHWRSATHAVLRNLRLKLLARGMNPVERVSSLGRGANAEYRITTRGREQ